MRHIIKQAIRFIGISGVGWIIDFIIYNTLSYIGCRVFISNIISSMVGVSFVFWFSIRKTFVAKSNGIKLKYKFIIYIAYQCILIFLISQLVDIINVSMMSSGITFIHDYSITISKILITPITMICNFVTMKILVERL